MLSLKSLSTTKGAKLKKSLILLIILFLLSLLTTTIARATENDFTGKPIPETIGLKGTELSAKTVTINPYKDNNQKLYGIVGKTQMIKFDEPVKRISITDPSFADLVLLSPKELLLNGKKAGRTSLIFWGNSEKPIFFNLVVQQDTDALIQAIEQIAPSENITYNFTDDGLILSGHISSTSIKKNIEEVVKAYNIKLVDLTESPTKQVLLEVKITEASRNFTKTLQTQFSLGQNSSSFLTDVLGITNLSSLANAVVNPIKDGTPGQLVFATTDIAAAISAAESKGMVKILAEPKLLAIDGQPGSFNVGQEIPYPASVGLSSTTSYSFKNTGVILNFTPTILEKSNRVILKLTPEISEIDTSYDSSTGVPGFKTRKVDTTVELADGETLIIAGLLSHRASNSDYKVPWLGDLPGVGFLFSSYKREKADVELVIFITPKIVDTNANNDRIGL